MAPASSASASTPRGAAPVQAQARAHHGAAGTTTTTILRVKRRRDEPPSHLPDTILLSAESLGGGGGGSAAAAAAAAAARRRASKRSRRGNRDDEALAGLMGRSTFITASTASSDNGNTTCGSNDQGAVRSAAGETSRSGGTTGRPSGAAGGGSGARFRRVPGGDLSALVLAGEDASGSASASASSSASVMSSKRVRVVDARICRRDSNYDDDDSNDNGTSIEDSIAARTDRDRSSSDPAAPRRKRARLVLDIVTARDVTGGDCDSDKLVNSGVEFWKSVASEDDTGDGDAGSSGTPIMDPVTRAVDVSLQAVFRHEKTVTQHLIYLQMDSLVLSTAQPRSERWVKLLNHTSSSAKAGGGATGTVLHAAAIFNDLDGARCALDLGIDPSLPDGDGHTALFIAETVGSSGVVALLSSHVGMNDYGNDNRQDEDEDDSDYVFDVYCLAGTKESARERDDWDAWDESMGRPSSFNDRPDKRKEINGDDSTKIQSDDAARGDSSRNIEEECRVEIKGGVGYWNEAGELVLEADKLNGVKTSAISDDASFVDADDHDSNDEGYEGNDYPDDDADADSGADGQSDADAYMMADSTFGRHGAGCGDSSDEEGLALYGRSYRHDAIPASAASGWSNVWSDTAQLADDSDEEGHNLSGFGMNDPDLGDDGREYGGPLGRVTYGETGLYGEGGACAYDPEHDEEE